MPMKKLIYPILTILILANPGFSQSSAEPKTKLTETQKLLAKREKFDPQRDSNQDLQTAVARAQKENKRIILDVGGEWCGWCLRMDLYLMKNPKLDRLRTQNFIWVKVNFSEVNENKDFLSKYPEIPGYPHLFVLESDGTLLHSQNTVEIEMPELPIVVPKNVKNKKKYLAKEYEKRKNQSYHLQKFTAFLKKWSPAKK